MNKYVKGSSYLVDYHNTRMKIKVMEVTDTSIQIRFENSIASWFSKEEFNNNYILVECIGGGKTLLQESKS